MGESVVDTTSYVKKVDKSVASEDRLEVSVSFGKFDDDSLSWEKFSTFSPNKYLEEVGKCATPGSVAEKKAYFEAHYKKIAARKAEELDQEKHDENTIENAGDGTCQDLVLDDGEFGYASNCESSVEGDPGETYGLNAVSSANVENSCEDLPISITCENLPVEAAEKQVEDADGSLTKDRAVLVKEEEKENETLSEEPQETKELPHVRNLEIIDTVDINKKKQKSARAKELQKVELVRSKEIKKVTPVNKERNVVKKKPVSPVTKSLHIIAPRVSKTAATNPSVVASKSNPSTLASRSVTKRTTAASTLKSRIFTSGESKKVASKSLDMSLGLGPSNSDRAPLSTTRRSFIMEQMGDKDIVKRAFKSFQKSFSQSKSSGEDKSSAPKQMSTKAKQPKVYAPMTPQKLIGSSVKAVSQDKKNAKAAPAPFPLKGDTNIEKKKNTEMKLVSSSQGKEAERTSIQTKIKGDKYPDIRKSKQNLNKNPLPVSGLIRGQKSSKSSLDEGNSNNKAH